MVRAWCETSVQAWMASRCSVPRGALCPLRTVKVSSVTKPITQPYPIPNHRLRELPEPNAEASQPTRRRRGGRRVVRGTGAAGASLELQVQEHAAPLFEAPALPDADASASTGTADNNASDDEKRPARRTRSRRSADNADYEDRPTRRRAVADDDDEPRPVRRRRAVSDDLEEDDERPIRRRRSVIDDLEDDDAPRSSRRRTAVDDADEDGDRPVRRRRSTTNDRDDRDDEPRSARRTRSRRSSEDAREENPDERVLDVIDALPAGA